MKQIIPFSKDITFKTKIGDITGISLDNDLVLKGEDLITGNFYIKGTYKMLKTSSLEEEYSYKVPCDIAISDRYDAYNAVLDIDDFTYEVIDDEILRVTITLAIDNLELREEKIIEEKEEVLESVRNEYDLKEIDEICDIKEEFDDIDRGLIMEEDVKEDITDKEFSEVVVSSIEEVSDDKSEEERDTSIKDKILEVSESTAESYRTYSVYIVREGDTIEKISSTYKVDITDIENYNDITNITAGMKLVIPSSL